MADIKITVRKNGPVKVEGPEGAVSLVDAEGHEFDLTGKARFSLCGCGRSQTLPFCDGTHKNPPPGE